MRPDSRARGFTIMKIGALAGAMAFVSACSMSIIPQGAARGQAPAPATQQDSEWIAGETPAAAPQLPYKNGAPPRFQPVDPAQLVKIGDDSSRATGAGIALGPDIPSLNLSGAKAASALQSFRTSCSSLVRREGNSGLTTGSDWQSSCDAAQGWPDGDAARFFASYFEAVQVGDGKAFATGYFEPQISGSRVRNGRYQVPIYRRPDNLLDVDLGLFSEDLKDKRIRGKVDGTKLVMARSPGRGSNSPGPRIISTFSSCRSRAAGGWRCPTARSCGSAMPVRMARIIPGSAS